MSVLEVKNLEKHFDKTKVLNDISFTLEQGQALSIIGSSGSGKTTLLRCLNFLETPDGGSISVNGEVLFDAADPDSRKDSDVRKKRLHFGLVFQSFNLFPQYTALQNVTLAPQLLAKEREDYKSRRKEINAGIEDEGRELLAAMGLTDRAGHYPHQLSGGQQQRVAIARALVNNPKMIIADEPTGNLDPHRSLEIMMLLERINDLGTTVLVVTHEKSLVNRFTKRVVAIEDGRIINDETGGYYNGEKV